jgi:hypothetical protein
MNAAVRAEPRERARMYSRTLFASLMDEDSPMPPRIARLAGYGAFAASALFLALIVLFIVWTRPTSSSGLDGTERFLSWLGVAGVLLALIGVHVVLGRRLLAVARGVPQPL